MLKSIKINELFGQFNYDIQFKPAGITIITGPNGFGKSTILKIIEAVAEKDLYEVCMFEFSDLEFTLENGKTFSISKKGKRAIINGIELDMYPKKIMDSWKRRHGLPFIERIGPDLYLDARYEKLLTFDEVQELRAKAEEDVIKDKLIATNYEEARQTKKDSTKFKELFNEYDSFKKNIGQIKFIKEQRLIRQEIKDEGRYYSDEKASIVETISELPKKMKEKIKTKILEYSETASKLDSTYPRRLFDASEEISQSDYLEEIGEIILKQEKIEDFGLIKDIKQISPMSYKAEHSKALKVFLNDTNKKLSVFDDFVAQLDLFVNIINSKLTYKKLVLSNEFGLKVVKENGDELSLTKLSSGEQQIIVLFFELIFETNNKLVLMIDEPEISLHVAWQRELMDDFRKTVEIKNDSLSIIIATHSPQVINNSWNLTVDLGAKNGDL